MEGMIQDVLGAGSPLLPLSFPAGSPGAPRSPGGCAAGASWRCCAHQLDRDHQDGLEREGPITQIKEIF